MVIWIIGLHLLIALGSWAIALKLYRLRQDLRHLNQQLQTWEAQARQGLPQFSAKLAAEQQALSALNTQGQRALSQLHQALQILSILTWLYTGLYQRGRRSRRRR